MSKLSVIIIALNEEANIKRAIQSVLFADEIIVVDSHSQDKTREVSLSLGAKVFQNDFLGYGQQKNFGISLASHDWIFSLDADEEVSQELASSIQKIISEKSIANIYYIERRTSFCHRFIYHGGWFPDHLARLGQKKDVIWTTPKVHEELQLIDGPIDCPVVLGGFLNHYSFDQFSDQVETNVKYAKLGALALFQKKSRPIFLSTLMRPLIKFLECYFFKRGFLDGREGLVIALNASYSQFMKYSIAYWGQYQKKTGSKKPHKR